MVAIRPLSDGLDIPAGAGPTAVLPVGDAGTLVTFDGLHSSGGCNRGGSFRLASDGTARLMLSREVICARRLPRLHD